MRQQNLGKAWTWMALGLLATPVTAQALVMPASDPVSIGRSGTGVAFGQSLEAAALNPALLSSLRPSLSVFLASGMEHQNTQYTLVSNQKPLYASDSNRYLPSFGAAWKLSPRLNFGLSLDKPYARHNQQSEESGMRFLGRAIDLSAHRLQGQLAFAVTPSWSVGVGLGLAKVSFANQGSLRAAIGQDPTLPVSVANPSVGLAETDVRQEGNKVVPAWSMGFRWAINPRWTLGGAVQGALQGRLDMGVVSNSRTPAFFANDGLSSPLSGVTSQGQVLLSRASGAASAGDFQLPLRATLGVRQRVNQLLTWEFDLRYLDGSKLQLPSLPGLNTPSGRVASPRPLDRFQSGWGGSATAEFTLDKRWTARLGAALEPALQPDGQVDPYLGGARVAAFSGGFGLKVLGGEINVGYQFRQLRDDDSNRIEGTWSLSGYRTVGTGTRTEGMGHLWSIGYKRSF